MEFIEMFNLKLKNLSNFKIEIINFGTLNVLHQLKQLERTGKKVRIEKLHNPKIKIRTVYDHTCSLAQTAQLLLKNNIFKCNINYLSTIILYHDLCEVLIYDHPTYTNYKVENDSINNLQRVDKNIREKYANNFLWLFASENQKENFKLLEYNNKEKEIAWILDKIDPIINVWRYMYFYYDELKNSNYIEIMSDFFTNPQLNSIIEDNKYVCISEIIKYLRDKNNAKLYLQEKNIINDKLSKSEYEIIKTLIEDTPLFYE